MKRCRDQDVEMNSESRKMRNRGKSGYEKGESGEEEKGGKGQVGNEGSSRKQ